jgi:hypothetical protein
MGAQITIENDYAETNVTVLSDNTRDDSNYNGKRGKSDTVSSSSSSSRTSSSGSSSSSSPQSTHGSCSIAEIIIDIHP